MSRKRKRAFTLVELLVVIGIIAVLISILLPTLSRARESANRARCLSNLRSLTQGWIMYAQENKGSLVWAGTLDKRPAPQGSTPLTDKDVHRFGWVIDAPGQSGAAPAVQAGAMWKHNPASDVYRCPSSIDKLNFRSYSISFHLNGEPSFFLNNKDTPLVTKLTRVKSDRMVFIEEYDTQGMSSNSNFNHGSFYNWKIGGANLLKDKWGDTPALFHQKGWTWSFADGHAEYRLIMDKRTPTAIRYPNQNAHQPNNDDLKALQMAMYGVP